MSYPDYDRQMADRFITGISTWIDNSPAYVGIDPEAHNWRRIQKVVQESGEAFDAYCGTLGENPRKGVTHNLDDVDRELFDAALSALGAVEHLGGNNGQTMKRFIQHIETVYNRAGLHGQPVPEVTS